MPIETNGLKPLEIAASIVFGRDEGSSALPEAPRWRDARSALEAALLPALLRSPCLVSFSGGRDSSALLAVAARVARREGLPQPVPVTALFPSLPQTREDEWQQQVVDELGLADWVRRSFDDEGDLVGPVARKIMTRRGLPFPYNLHLQTPLIEEARGGSFVTGFGGDEALTHGSRALAVVAGHVRPTSRDALRVAAAFAPRRLRRAVYARRPLLSYPWLRPEANHALDLTVLDDGLRLPQRWDGRLREWWRSRSLHLTVRAIARSGLDADVEITHPFAEPDFVSALARLGGARGFPSRTAAMHALFADVLPAKLLGRPTKASFNGVLWNRHTRSFVSELGDDGVERAVRALELEALVDARALAAHWSSAAPLANSFLLLQASWLALQPNPRSD